MEKAPLFAALLTPHRSLNRTGIHKLVAFYAILAAVPGVYFFYLGAWPVIGFLGADIIALWWALSASLKSGEAFEEITLWPDSLEIRHVRPNGRAIAYTYNPFWVRFEVLRDAEERVLHLNVRNKAEFLEIGAFLNPDDKASFAHVFAQALHKANH